MTRPGAGRWLDVPEVHVAIFSFFLHLVWEFLHVPLSPDALTRHWVGAAPSGERRVHEMLSGPLTSQIRQRGLASGTASLPRCCHRPTHPVVNPAGPAG
jgi:hypothetical protein